MSQNRTYKVGREGVIIGTFDEPEMIYLISCGKILKSDDYWTDGMHAWQKISTRSNWKISGSSISPTNAESGKIEPTNMTPGNPDATRRPFGIGTFISYPDDPTHGMDPDQKAFHEWILRQNAEQKEREEKARSLSSFISKAIKPQPPKQ